MTITKQITVWCDSCESFIQIDTNVSAHARREAQAIGWRYYGEEDHCPKHGGTN